MTKHQKPIKMDDEIWIRDIPIQKDTFEKLKQIGELFMDMPIDMLIRFILTKYTVSKLQAHKVPVPSRILSYLNRLKPLKSKEELSNDRTKPERIERSPNTGERPNGDGEIDFSKEFEPREYDNFGLRKEETTIQGGTKVQKAQPDKQPSRVRGQNNAKAKKS